MSQELDLTYLEEVTGGSEEIIKEMLELFLNDTPQQIALIKENSEKKNWDVVRSEAHKLKPSFLYIGLMDAHKKLEELETNARTGEGLENVSEKIDFIDNRLSEVYDEIKLITDS